MISPPAFKILVRAPSVNRRAQIVKLRNIKKTNVISHSANNDTDLITFTSFSATSNSSQRDWRSVGLAHKQPFQNDFVEFCISSSGKESVEFHQYAKVRILRYGGISMFLLVITMVDVNTHGVELNDILRGSLISVTICSLIFFICPM